MKKEEKTDRLRPQLKPQSGTPASAPPVALIDPSSATPKPTAEATNSEAFGREVERVMSGHAVTGAAAEGTDAPSPTLSSASPLPAPAEPTTTAPFVFDPAVAPVSESEAASQPESPAPAPKKKKNALFGSRSKDKEENKPSMFAAPSEETPNGETP